jgi:hypothetical protein
MPYRLVGFTSPSQCHRVCCVLRVVLYCIVLWCGVPQALHGDMLVPMKFIIPQDDKSYPQATWGMPLGAMTMTIRNGLSMKVGLTRPAPSLHPCVPSLAHPCP